MSDRSHTEGTDSDARVPDANAGFLGLCGRASWGDNARGRTSTSRPRALSLNAHTRDEEGERCGFWVMPMNWLLHYLYENTDDARQGEGVLA